MPPERTDRMKIAVIFSGQGAQKPGMGLSLYENSRAAAAVLDQAPADVREACFHGTEAELSRTEVTQPCIYTVSMAGYAALTEAIGEENVAMTAGFSLGEYAALTAAGVLDFATGLDLITKRGQWMAEAARPGDGMIAAIGKMDKVMACVETAEKTGMILPVNYNCPGQTVVAGEKAALDAFLSAAAANGLRAVPLKVSGAFHTPLMQPAAEKIRAALAHISLGQPKMPLYANVTGQAADPAALPELIYRQTMSPVRWETAIRGMLDAGAQLFIEVGVGTTLCGFMRRIDKSVKTLHVEDFESLTNTISEVKNEL